MEISQAQGTFLEGIKDAENLLAHFDKLNTRPPPPEIEVLKRTGLVMAMTAWETYVEDRVLEAASVRLAALAVKLTHFHGHLTVQERGVRSAQIQAAVPGGVSSTNH